MPRGFHWMDYNRVWGVDDLSAARYRPRRPIALRKAISVLIKWSNQAPDVLRHDHSGCTALERLCIRLLLTKCNRLIPLDCAHSGSFPSRLGMGDHNALLAKTPGHGDCISQPIPVRMANGVKKRDDV